MMLYIAQGRIQDFKLGGGGALKKFAPSGGRRENCWGISCEKSRFYAKKIIFFPILEGTRAPGAPPGSAPVAEHKARFVACRDSSSPSG